MITQFKPFESFQEDTHDYSNIVQRWYDAADPKSALSSSQLQVLIKDTDQFNAHIEVLKEQGLIDEVDQIFHETKKEFDKHGIGESELLAQLLAHNTSGTGRELNGAYKSFHHFVQMLADTNESPNYTTEQVSGFFFNSTKKIAKPYGTSKVLDPNFDLTSDFSPDLLNIMNIDAAALSYINKYKRPIPPIEDIEKLIKSKLDAKSLKNFCLSSSRYMKLKKIKLLNKGGTINEFKINSLDCCVTYFGKELCAKINHLDLRSCQQISSEDIDLLEKYFSNLNSLAVGFVKVYRDKSSFDNLTKKDFLYLQHRCSQILKDQKINILNDNGKLKDLKIKSIKHLVFYFGKKFCAKIKRLDLEGLRKHITALDVDLLAEYCPNLEHLSLDFCSITSVAQPRLATLTSLQSLSLNGCHYKNRLSNDLDLRFLQHLTKLETLRVRCDEMPYDSYYTLDFLKYCPSLITLDISGMRIRNLDPLIYCPKLKKLDVSHCGEMNDHQGILHCLALEYLNFRFCRRLSMKLLLELSYLKSVKFVLRDAIPVELREMLRIIGVRIHFDKGVTKENYKSLQWEEECKMFEEDW